MSLFRETFSYVLATPGFTATPTWASCSVPLRCVSTLPSTSPDTGSLIVSGGIGVAGGINVGGSMLVVGDITVDGTIEASGGIVATAAGENTQVQFNNATFFGASPDFTFDNTTSTLQLLGDDGCSVTVGQGLVNIKGCTSGQEVFHVETETTLSNPIFSIYQSRGTTTTSGSVTLFSLPVSSDSSVMIEARIQARQTGGSAGTVGNVAGFVITSLIKKTSGVLSALGGSKTIVHRDDAVWNCDVGVSTGPDVLIVTVNGAVNQNITWHATSFVQKLID
jgi:hypothetical protein